MCWFPGASGKRGIQGSLDNVYDTNPNTVIRPALTPQLEPLRQLLVRQRSRFQASIAKQQAARSSAPRTSASANAAPTPTKSGGVTAAGKTTLRIDRK